MIATILDFPSVRRLPHRWVDPERSPNLAALKTDARPGCCLICDEPLPPSRNPSKPRTELCGDRECKRVYDRTCAMDTEYRRKTRSRREVRKVSVR